MENKKAIEILKTECCAECSNQPLNVLECSANECPFKQAILLAIKALEAQRWIPVTERLPDRLGVYLVSVKPERAKHCCVEQSWFHPSDESWAYTDVLAWMPLPEPYTKEETI